MDSSTLLWTIDATRGSVNFGRLMPFAGNTYELVFAGVALEEVYTAYVMDESGLKCLAKSEHNAGEYTIAFNTSELRGEFERNMHEVQTFHVIVRDSKRVVAEGDLSVQWQSLWEDTTTGEVFTMRGPKGQPGTPGRKGDPGERGMSAYEVAVKLGYTGTEEEWLKSIKGAPGSMLRIQKIDANGEETGKWHNVFVKLDQNGRLRLVIEKTERDPDPSEDIYVSTDADMSIGGQKRFIESPIVPLIVNGNGEADVTDDSGKAINTKWLRVWWSSIWSGILANTQKFSAQCTFLGGVVGNVQGNVKGNLEGTASKAVADQEGKVIDQTYIKKTEVDLFTPAGTVFAFASETAPSGYLICNGAAVSRTTYSRLFSVIGTTYGTGDGSTTFNLPNMGTELISEISNTNIPVKGNNLTIGLTDGTNKLGVGTVGDRGPLYAKVANYGKPIGSSSTDSPYGQIRATVGLTTDPTQSGIVANMNATKTKVYWYIKF